MLRKLPTHKRVDDAWVDGRHCVKNGEDVQIVQVTDNKEFAWVQTLDSSGREGFLKTEYLHLGNDVSYFGRNLNCPPPPNPTYQRRIAVLHETLQTLSSQPKRDRVLTKALENLREWKKHCGGRTKEGVVGPGGVVSGDSGGGGVCIRVVKGDWGDVTGNLTREFGEVFAVLNMANAYVAGGGYVEGMPAQEENMFRRTDCHFSVRPQEFEQKKNRYKPAVTDLINGKKGYVELDTHRPRVCVRGAEIADRDDLGYEWLAKDKVFPFYEIRSAAVDHRGKCKRVFDIVDAREVRKRIDAQFASLVSRGVRHVVLSAFGCGAFLGPPLVVAQQYLEAIKTNQAHFDVVAFAIYYPGYGNDNFPPFNNTLTNAPSSVWSWKGDDRAWVPYDGVTQSLLESAYLSGAKAKLQITSTHAVDLEIMWQYRVEEPRRRRPVKREAAANAWSSKRMT